MSNSNPARKDKSPQLSRRDILKLGGGLVGAITGSILVPKALLSPDHTAEAAPLSSAERSALAKPLNQTTLPINKHLAATDGYIYIPGDPKAPYFPDNTAPAGLNLYIFGYHDVTNLPADKVIEHKMQAQLAAPILALDEGSPYVLKMTNLGLQMRPDLVDSHTVHFHGFRNAIPIFDGEPHSSVGVPIIRDLLYYYMPRNPGTYMYHCHFEETEHVHMGMVGPAYIRPRFNQDYPGRKFIYNDFISEYNREFILTLNEVWLESHWCDSHIQLPEWTDYNPDYYLINGRAYPDTIVGNGSVDLSTVLDDPSATGNMIAPAGRDELRFQPLSSLITANEGDRVALRIANLGFTSYTMEMPGIKMQVVGKDATLLRGLDGTDLTFLTSNVTIGPGESVDVIFIAPPYRGGGTDPDRYLFYNRRFSRLNNAGRPGYGGQMTEVWVYPAGYLPTQTEPNH